MPFHLESLCGATLVPHKECPMDCDKTKSWGWVKPPVRFWAICGPKFVKFCDNVWDPSHFPTPLPDCLCHVSFSRYSPLSVEVVEKPNKCKSFFTPFFREGRPQLFYGTLLERPTVDRLTKCGWVPFVDHLRSLAMKWNADFMEGGWKLTFNLKPFVNRSSCRFETM